jgi:protease-4
MKSFFKYVLATVTGIVITFILLFIVSALIIGAIISSASTDTNTVLTKNSVLRLDFDHQITERTLPNPFEDLDIPGLSVSKSIGLDDLLGRIKAAKDDDRIQGIYLDMSGSASASFATLQEIRDALLDFKASGKFIVSYSENYTQRAYYLASTADEIYVNPEGAVDFRGLSSDVMFLKGTLDKIGVEMQIVKVGTYKSAVEPFILQKMSDANREQVQSFMFSIYDHFIDNISASRGIAPDSLKHIADQFLAHNAPLAVQYGLAHDVKYKDQVLHILREKMGIEEDKEIPSVSILKYKPAPAKTNASAGRIAIVYASGEITTGEGGDEVIGSERISRTLRQMRTDKRIKAVVLRINSPGGSALASDVIWREVSLLSAEKPVIVSMGDVAASGGYYIAAAADSIFAQPNTLTGSIGVFGTIPNMQKLYNEKLGITFDNVKTGKFADFLSGNFDRPLTADEQRILQLDVNRTYNTFVQKVAEGRNLTTAQVDSIGQGRVWSGIQAQEIGLVDRLGSIEDAIRSAAYAAQLDEYRIVKYPTVKEPFALMMSSGTEQLKTWVTKQQLGESYTYYQQLKNLVQYKGVQARLPFDMEVY